MHWGMEAAVMPTGTGGYWETAEGYKSRVLLFSAVVSNQFFSAQDTQLFVQAKLFSS